MCACVYVGLGGTHASGVEWMDGGVEEEDEEGSKGGGQEEGGGVPCLIHKGKKCA